MLTVRSLECVRGERRLFTNLSFQLESGDLLRIEGPNGSGKTSLLRIVCGLLAPTEGEVSWRGESIRALAEGYFEDVFYLGHASAIKEEFSSTENLAAATALAGEPKGGWAIGAALERLGLSGRQDLPAKYLSQGQRRRVALSRLLLTKRRLWILDEPFVALDTGATTLVADIMAQHLDRGGIVLLTSHQDVPLRAARSQRLKLGA